MEKTLTNCLIKMRDDLSQLRHIRECLDSNPDSQYQNGECSISWRTIEAFNASLAAYKEKEMKEFDVLSTILDSFYYISTHNNEDRNWKNFGSDLGMICLKFLSLMEQTEIFEELFCKLLSTVDIICQHTSDAWKAIGRQILNIFINKKLSIASFETGLKFYISILRKIDISVLANFAMQNFHLIKTFFNTARRVGDIEIQTFIVEAAFLHMHNNKQLLENFIVELESEIKHIFHNLNLENIKDKCRIYLNILNNSESDKKVYSFNCKRIILGDCILEPPKGKSLFWLDANDSTKRLSVRCLDFHKKSSHDFLILIQFTRILGIQVEQQPENVFKIIFDLEKLNEILSFTQTDRMICTTIALQNSYKDIVAFKNFIEKHISKVNLKKEKLSQKLESVSIAKNVSYNTDINGTDNQKKFGINKIVPDALTLLSKMKNEYVHHCTIFDSKSELNENDIKNKQDRSPDFGLKIKNFVEKPTNQISPKSNSKSNTKQESKELSPNSFVESLNKNLGLDTPTISSSFEGSLLPMSFELNSLNQTSNSLFQESNIIFECSNKNSEFNGHPQMSKKSDIKEKKKFSNSTKRIQSFISIPSNTPKTKYLELSDTQSDIYFCSQSKEKRRPRMPKLKNLIGKNNEKKSLVENIQRKRRSKFKSNLQIDDKLPEKPSLLDPNGYAYKRWLEPTTSTRSKFWLKKIEQLDEKKKKLTEVFEFTDESDLEWKVENKKNMILKQTNKGLKKKEKNLGPKLKKSATNAKRKEESVKVLRKQKHSRSKPKIILANQLTNSNQKMKNEKNNTLEGVNYKRDANTTESNVKNQHFSEHFQKEASESCIEDSLKNCKENFSQINHVSTNKEFIDRESNGFMLYSYKNLIIERSSSFDSLLSLSEKSEKNSKKSFVNKRKQQVTKKTSDNECKVYSACINDDIELSEVDEDFFQKRKFPIEENFANNEQTSSKKLKTKSNKALNFVLQNRIKKFHLKIKQETDEIIETFAAATFRLVNYIHKKNVYSLISYMKKAEKTSFDLKACEFEKKIDKLEKVYVYYKNKCSSLNACDSALAHLSTAKNAIDSWSKSENTTWTKIKNYNNKLEFLINKQINDIIEQETESFRFKVFQYASLFNQDFDDWTECCILQK